MTSLLELHRLPSKYISREISENVEKKTKLTDQEANILEMMSGAIVQAVGEKDAHKVTLVGGVALRLLETMVDKPNEGVFSGPDIDLLYCDTDNNKLKALRSKFKSLRNVPRIDIDRFIRPYEAKTTFFYNVIQDKDERLTSSVMFGFRKAPIDNPLEILEIDYGSQYPIYTLSPTNLYYRYALRAMGLVKQRDWDEKKPHRLLRVNRKLNEDMSDAQLRRPRDYPELREFRKETKKGIIPNLVVKLVWIDNKLGRRWEGLGLASR